MLEQKASILRAKEIPFEVLRQPKTTKNEKIFLFLRHIIPAVQTFFL